MLEQSLGEGLPPNDDHVLITNLSQSTSREALAHLLRDFGDILDLIFRCNGMMPGVAIVRFGSHESAALAVQELDQADFKESIVHAKFLSSVDYVHFPPFRFANRLESKKPKESVKNEKIGFAEDVNSSLSSATESAEEDSVISSDGESRPRGVRKRRARGSSRSVVDNRPKRRRRREHVLLTTAQIEKNCFHYFPLFIRLDLSKNKRDTSMVHFQKLLSANDNFGLVPVNSTTAQYQEIIRGCKFNLRLLMAHRNEVKDPILSKITKVLDREENFFILKALCEESTAGNAHELIAAYPKLIELAWTCCGEKEPRYRISNHFVECAADNCLKTPRGRISFTQFKNVPGVKESAQFQTNKNYQRWGWKCCQPFIASYK